MQNGADFSFKTEKRQDLVEAMVYDSASRALLRVSSSITSCAAQRL